MGRRDRNKIDRDVGIGCGLPASGWGKSGQKGSDLRYPIKHFNWVAGIVEGRVVGELFQADAVAQRAALKYAKEQQVIKSSDGTGLHRIRNIRIGIQICGHVEKRAEGAWFVLPVKQEVLCCGIEPLAYGRGNVGVALQVKFGVEVRGKIASFHLAKRLKMVVSVDQALFDGGRHIGVIGKVVIWVKGRGWGAPFEFSEIVKVASGVYQASLDGCCNIWVTLQVPRFIK